MRSLVSLVLPLAALAALAVTNATSAAPPAAAQQRVELPDTPAGRLCRQWLDAINSGEPAAVSRFVREHVPQGGTLSPAEYEERFLDLQRRSGGLEVMGARDNQVVVSMRLRSRRGGRWAMMAFGVQPSQPEQLGPFQMVPFPDPEWDRNHPFPTGSLTEEEIAREIRRQVALEADADRFSGVVLVAKGDRILVHEAYGLAERDHAVPNRPDTKFHLGSMNKMFTAIAIAQLVEKGKLAFTDRLIDVLPDYPNREAAEKIRIEHLLTHQAGLGGLFERPRYDRRARYRTEAAYFPIFANEPLAFEPGARFSYSNEGFIVLGAVIERVSGQSYLEYIREHVYGPAGMTQSDSYASDETVPNRAVGYAFFEDDPLGFGPRRPNHIFLGWRGNGCGGGYSTAPDLLRFAQALRGHRLLSPSMTETITSSKISLGPRRYAYGFEERTFEGKSVRGHSGGGPACGINSDLAVFWDGSYTVAVLGNYDAPAAQELNRRLCEFLARQ